MGILLILLLIMCAPLIVRYFEKKKNEREKFNHQLNELRGKVDKLIEQIEKDKQ
ncbi:hypothetical protein [Tuberibacillus calidus]|uniref:hypothetical protein n=1 Tax=Tuberibacillus calidus TaxID=340097 RepID=UPI0004137891|nr:hypothetical protein [Tuberibacillus calidus]